MKGLDRIVDKCHIQYIIYALPRIKCPCQLMDNRATEYPGKIFFVSTEYSRLQNRLPLRVQLLKLYLA
jgi:hypothetical protein